MGATLNCYVRLGALMATKCERRSDLFFIFELLHSAFTMMQFYSCNRLTNSSQLGNMEYQRDSFEWCTSIHNNDNHEPKALPLYNFKNAAITIAISSTNANLILDLAGDDHILIGSNFQYSERRVSNHSRTLHSVWSQKWIDCWNKISSIEYIDELKKKTESDAWNPNKSFISNFGKYQKAGFCSAIINYYI